MDDVTQPKLFISYAHADGKSTVDAFWTMLRAFLNKPGRQWGKWDDKEISVGQQWDSTIIQALEQECNCCILLLSDLFAKSSYITDREWPKTLARIEQGGILFFPVVFGVLEGGLAALPAGMERYQVYWPTVSDLHVPPPPNLAFPDQVRQCYKDAKDRDATRDRFLSRLAAQMNDLFDEFLRSQATKSDFPTKRAVNVGEFVTNDTDEGSVAKAIFGSFSYEKRYRDSTSRAHYFWRSIDGMIDERFLRGDWVLVAGHPLAGKTRAVFEAMKRIISKGRTVAVWSFKPPERMDQPLLLPSFPKADYRILWMDDIDARFRDLVRRGYATAEINRFLESAADAGIMIAATIRTGPTYYDLRHRFGLDDHLWDKLESIFIPRLQGKEEQFFMTWYHGSFATTLPDKLDRKSVV